jgi:hypothetical protein
VTDLPFVFWRRCRDWCVSDVPRVTATSAGPAPLKSVVAATVQKHDVPIYLRRGHRVAFNNVIVRPNHRQLTSIAFTGAKRYKGDLLAEIDPRRISPARQGANRSRRPN